MSRFLNWLADLNAPRRSRHMPHRPMTPAVRTLFAELMAERRKLLPNDPRNAGVELEAVWFSAMLTETERDLLRQLRICYRVMAVQGVLLVVLGVVLVLKP